MPFTFRMVSEFSYSVKPLNRKGKTNMFITEIDVPATIRRDFIYNLNTRMDYQKALHLAAKQYHTQFIMTYHKALEHLREYALAFGYEPTETA